VLVVGAGHRGGERHVEDLGVALHLVRLDAEDLNLKRNYKKLVKSLHTYIKMAPQLRKSVGPYLHSKKFLIPTYFRVQ
jgi:hypothetical protein